MTKRNGSSGDDTPRIMTTEQAAEYLGLSPSTLNQWRGAQQGPAVHRYGKGPRAPVRYLRIELDQYLADTRCDGA